MTDTSFNPLPHRGVRRRRLLFAGTASAMTGLGPLSSAHAQAYPSRPIKLVVPFPPGGSVDAVARALAPQLQQQMGQAIVIENRPGANSVLGKARLILECFRLDDVDLSLTEISRRTGIAKASVYRLSQELIVWGMLERSGQDHFLGLFHTKSMVTFCRRWEPLKYR